LGQGGGCLKHVRQRQTLLGTQRSSHETGLHVKFDIGYVGHITNRVAIVVGNGQLTLFQRFDQHFSRPTWGDDGGKNANFGYVII
jgi:hypothetical protein